MKNIMNWLFGRWFGKPLYKCQSCGFIQRDCNAHKKIDFCICGKDNWKMINK